MEAFGRRIVTIRKELGLTQRALAAAIDTDQPRIARIEKGTVAASVALIDKLAHVFGRKPADLVAGTDREVYYFAQGLAPEQLAEIRSSRDAMRTVAALTLLALYERIVATFAALHAGPYIIAPVSGEERYLAIRDFCAKAAADLGDAPNLYYPDHFEIISDDDALERDFVDEELRKSLLELRGYVHRLNIAPDVAAAVRETQAQQFAKFDEQTEELRQFQIRENRLWLARLDKMKAEGHFDGFLGDSESKK